MKIALFAGRFPIVSETFVINQIKGLIDYGNIVSIFCDKPKLTSATHKDVLSHNMLNRTYYYKEKPNSFIEFSKYSIYMIVKLLSSRLLFFSSIRAIRYYGVLETKRLLRVAIEMPCNDYDIIYSHFGTNGILANKLRRSGFISGKLITVFHGYDVTKYIRKNGREVYSDLFHNGDLFLPISKFWEKELIQYGCDKDKIKVHHMGVKTTNKPLMERRAAGENTKLLVIARLVEKKGVEFLIESLSLIDCKKEKIKLTIVGGGPLQKKLVGVVEKYNLQTFVKFTGELNNSEVNLLLLSSDILIAPSVTTDDGDMEGIPVVLMEAMNTNVIAISTYHSGIPELINNNVNGFLVEERDVKGLADLILKTVSNKTSWNNIHKKAHETIDSEYNIEKLNVKLIKHMSALIKGDRN